MTRWAALLMGLFSAAVGAQPALLAAGQEEAIEQALGLEDLEEAPFYTLDLSLSDMSGHFEGRGRLRWTNRTGQPQSVLPLLLHTNGHSLHEMRSHGGMQIREVRTRRGPSGEAQSPRPSLVNYVLDRALAVGETIELEFRWEGWLRNLGDDDNDLYQQAFASLGAMASPVGGADYGLLAAGDGLLTMASAYPMLAPYRNGVPQTDAPAEVGDLAWNQIAGYRVRVVTPTGLEVVTNLEESRRVRLSGGEELTEASGWGVRDFVLVASREFARSEGIYDGVRVRSWYLERDSEAGEKTLAEAAEYLSFFSETYGDYPFTELDVVEATLVGGAGGVEFSGMVLMAGFLYRDPGSSQHPMGQLMNALSGLGGAVPGMEMAETMDNQRRFVLAHELAHQWSPSLVGTNAHRSPVVDEPLAQYFAGRAIQNQIGDVEGASQRDQNVLLNYAVYRLMGGADAPADRPTGEYSGALEYAALIYGKAPYFYVDLEQRVGRGRLDAAIAGAIEDLAWGVVDGQEWLETMERNGATQASILGSRWWSESHGDEDLELDPEGHRALAMILGEEVGAATSEMLSGMGLTPASLFGMLSAFGL
ncbi:MAG: hypothetical protein VXW32_00670 [Myxococcota bacterium]|nr:hypothetical protein [Myxococcota bacterium]